VANRPRKPTADVCPLDVLLQQAADATTDDGVGQWLRRLAASTERAQGTLPTSKVRKHEHRGGGRNGTPQT
jgi:hypothetical protein